MSKRDRDVPIEVVSRHQHVSEKTRAFALEKAQRLSRYNDRIARVQVLLDEEHAEFLTEIIVHVESGATLVGKGTADGYRASMDSALEKLERQLKKDKEKRRNHKHDSAAGRPDSGPDEDDPTYEEVIRDGLAS